MCLRHDPASAVTGVKINTGEFDGEDVSLAWLGQAAHTRVKPTYSLGCFEPEGFAAGSRRSRPGAPGPECLHNRRFALVCFEHLFTHSDVILHDF